MYRCSVFSRNNVNDKRLLIYERFVFLSAFYVSHASWTICAKPLKLMCPDEIVDAGIHEAARGFHITSWPSGHVACTVLAECIAIEPQQ